MSKLTDLSDSDLLSFVGLFPSWTIFAADMFIAHTTMSFKGIVNYFIFKMSIHYYFRIVIGFLPIMSFSLLFIYLFIIIYFLTEHLSLTSSFQLRIFLSSSPLSNADIEFMIHIVRVLNY